MSSHPTGIFLYSTVAAIMSCSAIFGLTLTFPALTIDDLIKDFNFSSLEATLFNSLPAFFAIAGPFIFQPFMEKMGRRFSIRIVALSSFISYAIFCLCNKSSKYITLFHRGTMGLIIGGISSIAPVYLVEIAAPPQKNTFGSLNQLGISTGCVLGNLLGGIMYWRSLAVTIALLSITVFLFSFFMPESPAYISKRKINKPSGSSNDPSTVLQNNTEIRISTSLFDGSFTNEIIDACMYMFFQQFSGINGLLTNVGMILNNSTSAATLGASAQCISCLFCSAALSKLGIKKTWIISCSGTFLSLMLLAISQSMNLPNAVNGVSLFGFQLSFGFGLGPIPWMMTPILFPDSVRSQASSLLSSLNWLMAFIVIFIFPTMKLYMGITGSALLFAFVMCAGTIFGCKIRTKEEQAEVEFQPDVDESLKNEEN